MRTQLILTTAAFGLAGALGASAQVYSVNAVGYINTTVPAKSYALVANQLNAGGNTIKDVIPSAPDGTTVFKYTQAGGFSAVTYDGLDNAWSNPAATLKPGEGAFLQNNGAAPLTVTFVGEVPQGSLTTGLLKGLNLVASQVPQAGKLTADLKFPAADGDTVFQWDIATQKYKPANTFDALDAAWSGGDPAIGVGEGFFVSKAAAGSWDRSFSVN